MAVNFWDLFFDSNYRQRADINELRDLEWSTSSNVASIGAYTAQLRRQVHDLSMTVAILVKMLEEAGQIDAKTLRYRVEAEIEAMAAAEAQSRAGGPNSLNELPQTGPTAQPERPEPLTTLVSCVHCGAEVPANETTITERGTVCDRCEAGR
jgi:hypothetical protein